VLKNAEQCLDQEMLERTEDKKNIAAELSKIESFEVLCHVKNEARNTSQKGSTHEAKLSTF
jgi:hypothetical protein